MKKEKDNLFLPTTSVDLIPNVSVSKDDTEPEIDDAFLNDLLEQLKKHNKILKVIDLREESLNFRLLGKFERAANTYYAPVLDNSDNKIKIVVAGSEEVSHIENAMQKEMLKIDNILSKLYHFKNYDLDFRLNDVPEAHISKRSHSRINFKFPKELLKKSMLEKMT